MGAFFLDDILNSFTKQSPTQPTLSSNISPAPHSGANDNQKIDGGDTIRFTYNIQNNSNTQYSFLTLETNIPRNFLNFIHNITGTISMSDNGKTITFPNLRLNPGQTLTIHFDARVNYFSDADKTIFTAPELKTKDRKSIVKSARKEVVARKWTRDYPSMILRKQK